MDALKLAEKNVILAAARVKQLEAARQLAANRYENAMQAVEQAHAAWMAATHAVAAARLARGVVHGTIGTKHGLVVACGAGGGALTRLTDEVTCPGCKRLMANGARR